MPGPQPRDSSSVKRPPILKNGSSSSSLRGMEQSVPSFQTFIKRTPPPDPLKPLPPTPLRPHQRAPSFDSGISQCSSSSGRRSSSVYSRTVSQWDPEWDSQSEEVPEVPPLPDWRSADFADQDNKLLLRPIAYSASTSQVLEKNPQQDQQPVTQPKLLEPRAYRPLIVTPSPTTSASPSRATTPSPRPSSDSRPSILLPPPPASAQVPKKHLRTVPLEKAQELIQAPGAVHLLPEEQCAQQTFTRKTTRSQEPMRMVSREGFHAGTVPSLEFPASPSSPVLPTLIDEYGRERLLASPRESRVPLFSYEMPSPSLPPVGEWKGAGFPFRAPERFEGGHDRAVSRENVVQTPRFDQMGEDRGRARIRESRSLSYGNYIPSPGRGRESRIGEGKDYGDQLAKNEALRIAQDYHILLKEEQQERCRQPSSSPTSRGSETDDVRVQMKMVPQPLFHAKPWSGTHFGHGSADDDFSSRSSVQSKSERTGASPFHLRSGSEASVSSSRGSSDGHGSFPLRLSTTPPPRPSRGSSTSGTIPISPPFAATAWPKKMSVVSAKALPLAKQKMKKDRTGRNRWDEGGENRVSMYYPHVMSRRTKKEGRKKEGGGKEKKKKKGKEVKQEEVSPGVPLLAADIVAQRLETPETTPEASLRSDSASGRSAVVEEKPTLHQLVLKGAARYAEKLTGTTKQAAGPASSVSASTAFTKPQYQYTHDEPSADLHRFASPESPHLLPSPSSASKPPPIHLGWSTQSKTSFDRIRSPTVQQSPKHRQRSKDLPAAAQGTTHIQTPARPMNERIAGLKQELSASEIGGGNGGNSGAKPAGILGGLMESWRESKAEKRREDLRKMIRVVTPAGVEGGGRGGVDRGLQELRRGSVGAAGGGGGREVGFQRPAGQMQRRLNAFNWM
ncbi:hypothetical protein D0860_06543 [Hortaea werneckii]|uniref:Uncharacterized protein n=1 Tax=Hortaea werneckii TaxID=91943 RepID=A0A3M7GSC2_HORWE|nr:hypothetical protein D0860_06543 [Hortaea werneckii]